MKERIVEIDFNVWTTIVRKAAAMKCSRQYVWAEVGRGKIKSLFIREINLTLVEK